MRRTLLSGRQSLAGVRLVRGPPVWRGRGLASVASEESLRLYTRGQVAEHNQDDDLWVIVDRRVYDVTEWLNFHPGGRDILIKVAGSDATETFNEIGHSEYARGKMSNFLLGRVAEDARYNPSEYEDRIGEV